MNTTVIIKLPAGVVRLSAGDKYGFEVCPGMSLRITDVERQA